MKKVSLKEINKLAIPAIFAGISEPVISLADSIVLGHLPDGETVLSAMGNASGFYLTIVWVLAQTKSAVSALVSRALGKDALKEVSSLVPQAIWLNIVLGLLLMGITVPLAELVLGEVYQTKGITLTYATEYYSIRAIGFPFILSAFAIFGVFRGLQNTLWAMIISITGALLNVVLDLILVYGVEGVIDPMHIEGAAIASLIAQVYMFVFALYYLFRRTPFRFNPGKKLNQHLRELAQITVNLFVRTIFLNLAVMMASRAATILGDVYNSAHQLAYQIWLFTAFFIDGYSGAANAISGKLLGQKDYVGLKFMVRDVIKYNLMISVGLGLVILALYPILGSLLTSQASVIENFDTILWMVVLVLPLNAIAFSLDGVFKGLGEAAFLRNVLMVATLLAFLPTLFITQELSLELHGIWMAMIAWMLVRSSAAWIRFTQMISHKIKESNS